jgi:hypothetical protein
MPPRKTSKQSIHGATIGFETQLWVAADKLRGLMDSTAPSASSVLEIRT